MAHAHRRGPHQQRDLMIVREVTPRVFQILRRQKQAVARMAAIETEHRSRLCKGRLQRLMVFLAVQIGRTKLVQARHVDKFFDSINERRARRVCADQQAPHLSPTLRNGAESINDGSQHAIHNIEADLNRDGLAGGFPTPKSGRRGMMRKLRIFSSQRIHYLIK